MGRPAPKNDFDRGLYALERGDYTTALNKLRPSAEQGHARAQFNLGTMYLNGDGVLQDDNEAVKWYKLSSEQGNAEAQTNLGQLYHNGQGVARDDREAVKLYKLAAEQKNGVAQAKLGTMYHKGIGTPQDYVLAYVWYNLAAINRIKTAIELKDIIVNEMSPEQITEAKKISRRLEKETLLSVLTLRYSRHRVKI